MSIQDDLIGRHPAGGYLNGVVSAVDEAPIATKCHRRLLIDHPLTDADKDSFSHLLILGHFSDDDIQELKDCYSALGYPKYGEMLAAQNKLPSKDKLKKGNLVEILLENYLVCLRKGEGKDIAFVYRLRYNPNVDFAMHGDDVLIVEKVKDTDCLKLYLGEAKYRKTPATKVLDDIYNALDYGKMPLSYAYLKTMLRDENSPLYPLLIKNTPHNIFRQGNMIYVGMLFSNSSTGDFIEKHWSLNNPCHVILSLGLDYCDNFINEIYDRAKNELGNGAAGL